MGVTDKFAVINAGLTQELGYHLDPRNADSFRQLIEHAGIRRVQHAIQMVKADGHRGGKAHPLLIDTIWRLLPPKRGKYRSPETAHAKQVGREMDQRAMDLAAKE